MRETIEVAGRKWIKFPSKGYKYDVFFPSVFDPKELITGQEMLEKINKIGSSEEKEIIDGWISPQVSSRNLDVEDIMSKLMDSDYPPIWCIVYNKLYKSDTGEYIDTIDCDPNNPLLKEEAYNCPVLKKISNDVIIKEGSIIQYEVGHSMVLPRFARIESFTASRKSARVTPLKSKTVSTTDGGYGQAGYCIPIDEADGSTMTCRIVDNQIPYVRVNGHYSYIWNGEPQYFDHRD